MSQLDDAADPRRNQWLRMELGSMFMHRAEDLYVSPNGGIRFWMCTRGYNVTPARLTLMVRISYITHLATSSHSNVIDGSIVNSMRPEVASSLRRLYRIE